MQIYLYKIKFWKAVLSDKINKILSAKYMLGNKGITYFYMETPMQLLDVLQISASCQ